MWEKALIQAIGKSSTWDIAIIVLGILIYKMAMKKSDGDISEEKLAIRYLFYLGVGTLLARVILTLSKQLLIAFA